MKRSKVVCSNLKSKAALSQSIHYVLEQKPWRLKIFTRRQIKARPGIEAHGHHSRAGVYSTVILARLLFETGFHTKQAFIQRNTVEKPPLNKTMVNQTNRFKTIAGRSGFIPILYTSLMTDSG